jgi:hypothetical protein
MIGSLNIILQDVRDAYSCLNPLLFFSSANDFTTSETLSKSTASSTSIISSALASFFS